MATQTYWCAADTSGATGLTDRRHGRPLALLTTLLASLEEPLATLLLGPISSLRAALAPGRASRRLALHHGTGVVVAAAQVASHQIVAVKHYLLHGRRVYEVDVQELICVALIPSILAGVQLRGTTVCRIRVAAAKINRVAKVSKPLEFRVGV